MKTANRPGQKACDTHLRLGRWAGRGRNERQLVYCTAFGLTNVTNQQRRAVTPHPAPPAPAGYTG